MSWTEVRKGCPAAVSIPIRGRIGRSVGWAVWSTGVVPAFWLGALYGGASGVALAWVTAYPIVTIWMAREALRELHASFGSLCMELRAPVTVTAVMMLAVLGARHLLSSVAADLAWERLAILVMTGVVVYGAGLLAIGGPVRGELLELAGWLFRRTRPAGTAVLGT